MHFWGSAVSAYEKFLRTGNISYLYQMDGFDMAIVTAYFVVLSILSFYGIHRYLMVFLYHRHGKKVPTPKARFETLPRVTVQIPSYNEIYVIERVIDSACALDYPGQLLDIQVLDDSTDETRVIADNAVRRWRSLGVDITLIHRADRSGFKAGALENGLRTAKGEFVAIFDADFVPGADFLQRTIHYFSDHRRGADRDGSGALRRDPCGCRLQPICGQDEPARAPLRRVHGRVLDAPAAPRHVPDLTMPVKARRRRLMREINVVPYIDVMLVLLIIFMVTAPLLSQGVQVELPDADAQPIDPELLRDREPLVLSVDRDGRYFLNVGGNEDSPIGEAEVARRAGAVLAREPATPVLVKADERVPYGSVVRGMVLLQRAGAKKIGFLTDPKAVRALEELERRR